MNRNTSKPFYKKKWFIIVIIILIMGVIGGIMEIFSEDKETTTVSAPESQEASSPSESAAVNIPEEIIWKEDGTGILNVELDGTHTKQVIINNYYIEITDQLEKLDKSTIDTTKYEYIICVGNVIGDDGKIQCTIKGKISTEYVKNTEDWITVYVEDNMEDVFIPKSLR